MYKLLFTCLFAIVVSITTAQDRVQLTVEMKNGDVITGFADIKTISFSTSYGNMNFPIDDVDRIELGIQSGDVDKTRLNDLLDKVQFASETEALAAFDEVTTMGASAIPVIRDYKLSVKNKPKENAAVSIDILYDVMLAINGLDRTYNINDVLTYNEKFTVDGRYSLTELSLETDYGNVIIGRKQIRSIQFNYVDDKSGVQVFKLFGDKHISGRQNNSGWLNTGILIKAGDNIKINSSGKITMASLSGNSYTADGGVNGAPGPSDNMVNYGNVVFKLGDGGGTIKAGADYNGLAPITGVLYLSVYETVYNAGNSGSYTVEVRVSE